MSVYIRGMEMPTSCFDCPCCNGENGYCQLRKEYVYGEVPRSCLLVPVPDHGRLGDLDDFAKRMKNLVEKAEGDGFDLGAAWYSAFVRHIELTPTVIPADTAEEGE